MFAEVVQEALFICVNWTQSLKCYQHQNVVLLTETYFAFFLLTAASAVAHGVTDMVDVYVLARVSPHDVTWLVYTCWPGCLRMV